MMEEDRSNVDNTVVKTAKMNNKDLNTNDQKVLPDKYSSVHKTKHVDVMSYSHKPKKVLCISKRDFKKTHKTLKKKIKKEKVKKAKKR